MWHFPKLINQQLELTQVMGSHQLQYESSVLSQGNGMFPEIIICPYQRANKYIYTFFNVFITIYFSISTLLSIFWRIFCSGFILQFQLKPLNELSTHLKTQITYSVDFSFHEAYLKVDL